MVQQQQHPIVLPPMIVCGSVWFAPQAILAVDFSEYEAGDPKRRVTVSIVGPHLLDFLETDADAFKGWWDQVTGQARIQPAPPGLKLS